MTTKDVVFRVDLDHWDRFVTGMSNHYDYEEVDIDGIPNPKTRAQYAHWQMRQEMVQRVKRQERKTAIDALEIDEIEVTD